MPHAQTLEDALLAGEPPFTLSRLPTGTIGAVPRYGWYRLLHGAALAAGASCYQDPISNELVATSAYLTSHPELCAGRAQRHGHATGLPEDAVATAASNLPLDDAFSDESDARSDSGASDASGASSSYGGIGFRPPLPLVSGGKMAIAKTRRQVVSCSCGMQVLRLNTQATAGLRGNAPSRSAKATEAAARSAAQRRQDTRVRGPSPFLRKQSRPLAIADIRDMEDILKLPHYAQTGRLHTAAEERGLDSYRDPQNGCMFYTRTFLAREPCCGDECRHCPYGRVQPQTAVAKGQRPSLSSPDRSSASSSSWSSRDETEDESGNRDGSSDDTSVSSEGA